MATRAKLPSSMGAAAHVAERVREHRAALGLSQEELARACHVSRQTISNWETARTLPDIQSLTTIARLAGTTVDALIGNDAPAVLDEARTARRDLLVVSTAWKALMVVAICLSIFRYFAEQMLEVSGLAGFVYQLLGNAYLYLGGAEVALMLVDWRLCKRNGLKTGDSVADFIKGAAKVPGSWQDRLLRFQARWSATFWMAALLAASVLSVAAGLLVLGDALPLAPEPDVGTRLQNQMALAHPHWFIEQTDPFGYLMLVLGIEVVAVVWAAFFDRRRRKRAAHR